MKTKRLLLLIVLFGIYSLNVTAIVTKKLLVIGIDGCRADAITPTLAPTITALLPNSTYSFSGLTSSVTISCVGWSNMCTGVWPTKHNIMNTLNSFSANNFAQWPDFFTYIKNSNSALNTASFCNWGDLNTHLLHTDHEVNTAPYSDATTTQNAIDYITNNNPDALLVDLDEVDHAGHSHSFDPTNTHYATAVTTADGHVASLINAVKARTNYANEDWLIIITTDHGGNGSEGHGGGTLAERTVWTVVNGGNATINNNISNTSTTAYAPSNSISLNGTGNYLKATDKTAFNFGTVQDFSIECKVKINSILGDPCVISNQNWADGKNKGFTIYIQNGIWYFNVGDGVNRVSLVGSPIVDGLWHTLSVTVDRNKYIAIYQDGVFIGSTICNNIANISSGLDLAIGQDGTTGYGSKLEGSVCDVRIWNAALSGAEIKEWYNQDVTASHTSYASLNAYWKINDGAGTTAVDTKGSNDLLYQEGPSNVAVVWNGLTTTTTPTFENAMKLVDIAVTALDHFSLRPSDLDGKSLLPTAPIAAPVANFISDITTLTKNNAVIFTSTSSNNPTAFSWSFPGGTPSTSTDAHPIVKYSTPGTYDVSMTATNGIGSDTKTSVAFITVTNESSLANALTFDGTSNFVSIPEEVDNNIATSDFTIEFWMHPANTSQSDPSILGTKNWNSGTNIGWVVVMLGHSTTPKIKFNLANGVSKHDVTFACPPANVWSHIAIVVARTGVITAYVNGIAQTLTITDGTLAGVTGDVSTTLGLKLAQDGTGAYDIFNGTSPHFWAGKLDEVRIWKAARTAIEIQNNKEIEISDPSSESDLVAYYNFNHANGFVLADQKSNNHGILKGFMNASNWVASTAIAPPIADFTPDITTLTKDNAVLFTNTSSNNPTAFSWSFPGGTPSTSTDVQPIVKYSTPGTYDVSMTATNAQGSDSKTSVALITVTNQPSPANTLTFNGTSNYVAIPEEVDNSLGTSDFTIEFWMNPANTTQSDPSILGTKNWNSGLNIGWVVVMTGHVSTPKIKFNIANGAIKHDVTFACPPANVWSHITIVVARTGIITAYVNGVAQTISIVDGTLVGVTGNVSTTLGLKLAQDGTGAYDTFNGTSPHFWAGKLDEVRIWKAARTAVEIQNNQGIEISNPSLEADLVAYYNFNHANGLGLADQKGSNHAVLKGGMSATNWLASTAIADITAPTTPTNLSFSNLTGTSLSLSWDASADNVAVEGYNVFNGTTLLTTTTQLSYDITGLSQNNLYTFKVSAIDAAANESSTATIDVSTSITSEKIQEIEEIGKVFSNHKIVYIESKSATNSTAEVYNVLGQKQETLVLKTGINSIRMQTAGIFIIKISTTKGTAIKKVRIE